MSSTLDILVKFHCDPRFGPGALQAEQDQESEQKNDDVEMTKAHAMEGDQPVLIIEYRSKRTGQLVKFEKIPLPKPSDGGGSGETKGQDQSTPAQQERDKSQEPKRSLAAAKSLISGVTLFMAHARLKTKIAYEKKLQQSKNPAEKSKFLLDEHEQEQTADSKKPAASLSGMGPSC